MLRAVHQHLLGQGDEDTEQPLPAVAGLQKRRRKQRLENGLDWRLEL